MDVNSEETWRGRIAVVFQKSCDRRLYRTLRLALAELPEEWCMIRLRSEDDLTTTWICGYLLY